MLYNNIFAQPVFDFAYHLTEVSADLSRITRGYVRKWSDNRISVMYSCQSGFLCFIDLSKVLQSEQPSQ